MHSLHQLPILIALSLTSATAAVEIPNRAVPIHWRIHNLVFSADGKLLAVTAVVAHNANIPGKSLLKEATYVADVVEVPTLSNCEIIASNPSRQHIGLLRNTGSNAAFSLDDKSLYVLCGNEVKLWNLRSREWTTNRLLNYADVLDFQLSPAGNLIAIWRQGNRTEVRDLETGEAFVHGHDFRWPLRFSNDGKNFVATNGQSVELWDVTQRKLAHVLHLDRYPADSKAWIAASPSGSDVVIRASDDLQIFNFKTGLGRVLSERHFEFSNSVSIDFHGSAMSRGATFSPDGKVLAVWSDIGIKFYNTVNNFKLQRSVPDSSVTCISFSPDSKIFAIGRREGKLALYDATTGDEIRRGFFDDRNFVRSSVD